MVTLDYLWPLHGCQETTEVSQVGRLHVAECVVGTFTCNTKTLDKCKTRPSVLCEMTRMLRAKEITVYTTGGVG